MIKLIYFIFQLLSKIVVIQLNYGWKRGIYKGYKLLSQGHTLLNGLWAIAIGPLKICLKITGNEAGWLIGGTVYKFIKCA